LITGALIADLWIGLIQPKKTPLIVSDQRRS
jgi:hypothetical protein